MHHREKTTLERVSVSWLYPLFQNNPLFYEPLIFYVKILNPLGKIWKLNPSPLLRGIPTMAFPQNLQVSEHECDNIVYLTKIIK